MKATADAELYVWDFDGWEIPDDMMLDLKVLQDMAPRQFENVREMVAVLAQNRFRETPEA